MHYVLPFRVVVETVLGQVDDDAFTRPRRQDVAGRQDDLGTGARQPRVDAWVGSDHFQVAEIVGGTDVGEGVFVLGLDSMDLADNVLTGGGNGSSSATAGPVASKAARVRLRVTAGKRGNIREILRKVSQGNRLYTRVETSGRRKHFR